METVPDKASAAAMETIPDDLQGSAVMETIPDRISIGANVQK